MKKDGKKKLERMYETFQYFFFKKLLVVGSEIIFVGKGDEKTVSSVFVILLVFKFNLFTNDKFFRPKYKNKEFRKKIFA